MGHITFAPSRENHYLKSFLKFYAIKYTVSTCQHFLYSPEGEVSCSHMDGCMNSSFMINCFANTNYFQLFSYVLSRPKLLHNSASSVLGNENNYQQKLYWTIVTNYAMQLPLKPMRVSPVALIRITVNSKGTQRGSAMAEVISHQQKATKTTTKGKEKIPISLTQACAAVLWNTNPTQGVVKHIFRRSLQSVYFRDCWNNLQGSIHLLSGQRQI